ncbi:MAG: repair protein RecO [Pseudomonadota bacterium]|jgi:DNA repair protein RecO (recombination protein O)
MALRRVTDESAFVLHRYDWSEASLVLEVLTRQHGRMALVAKGVKRPTSQFRPVLLPLQPLLLSWGGDAEVRTLKSAQWQGGHVMPTGEALLAGSYLNELLLRLLARDDPHPRLFDHYRRAVQLLASGQGSAPWVLRAFELVLLRETGLLPDLSHEGSTLAPVQADQRYALDPENGLRMARAEEAHTLLGEYALLLQAALDADEPDTGLWAACALCETALRRPLRTLLHYHSGVQVFKTRQLMLDVQALNRTPP